MPQKDSEAESLADRIRAAARESGKSVYQIAKDAAVDQGNLCKFLNGDRDHIRLDVAERLLRVLGFIIVRKRTPGRSPAKSPTPDL